jgi:hypothetical protein
MLSKHFCRDLSFNIGLGGTMPASIGSLSQLTTLYVLLLSVLVFLIRHVR